ncbi:MAG TPA: response regulator, partial [Spirochaetota bacterium]|nr:response regulator [Spirochaetota bacterium]
IDDKEFHRKQIIQILESEGYEIIAAASNGTEALKLYESLAADLDLITTDLDMPKLDGYALLYELSHKKPKAKIVFISEETTKGVLSDLLKMGAADFILKPIQRGTILERIKAVLQKK